MFRVRAHLPASFRPFGSAPWLVSAVFLAALAGTSGCEAPIRIGPGRPFIRLTEFENPEQPWLERKQKTANVTHNVLMDLPITPYLKKEVQEGACWLEPGKDFQWHWEESRGIRISVYPGGRCAAWEEQPEPIADWYVARGAVPDGRFQVKVPAEADATVYVRIREVASAAWCHKTQPVVIPNNGKLETAVTLQQDLDLLPGVSMEASLSIETRTGTQRLFETVLTAPEPGKELGWEAVHIDLGAYAGQKARFVFEAEPHGEQPALNLNYPLWANPTMYPLESLSPAPGPNVLLICLDTLRADRLGCYGYGRPTSPRLDAFAEKALLFEEAIAPSTWTLPSHASVFTGLHPAVHLAGWNQVRPRLRVELETLAETFRKRGYLTAAFTEGVAVQAALGFSQGFDVYSDGLEGQKISGGFLVEQTIADAAAWLERYQHLPFFLFVHTYQVHEPYGAPAGWESKFCDVEDGLAKKKLKAAKVPPNRARERASNRYDSGIAYADDVIGGFLDSLDERGVLDDTLVIVFSDHGEEFWEHGQSGHVYQMYREHLHVPLIMRMPGSHPPRGRVERLVALQDIYATAMKMIDAKLPEDSDSQDLSLLASEEGKQDFTRKAVFSDARFYSETGLHDEDGHGVLAEYESVWKQGERYGVTNRSWLDELAASGTAWSEAGDSQRDETYFLHRADPAEEQNVAEAHPEQVEMFRETLRDYLKKNVPREDAEAVYQPFTSKEIDAMKALGYL